jgi:transposase
VLVYLPAYSPDYSPIEQAFSKLEVLLRQLSASDAHGWFRFAGYASPAHAP